MSIKRYCDDCGKELGPFDFPEGQRFVGHSDDSPTKWRFEIILTFKGTSNKGDICRDCLYKLLDIGRTPPPPKEKRIVSDPLKPGMPLLCKLGSIAQHADEMLSTKGHHFDKAALQSVLQEPDVKEWLKQMDKLALTPSPP